MGRGDPGRPPPVGRTGTGARAEAVCRGGRFFARHSFDAACEAPLMLAGTLPRSVALARKVGIPELIMCDEGHAAGRRMRDYGAFADPASPKTALLIEAGQHW